MHKFNFKLRLLLLIAPFLLLQPSAEAFSKRKKTDKPILIAPLNPSLPELPSYNPYRGSIWDAPHKSAVITPILDYLRSIECSDLPEEYDIWSDTKINPYQVSLVDMVDTVKIDVSGYFPPSTKYVTSDFGFRRWRHHYGIDLKVHKGDSVYNAFDGVVRITKRVKDYGNYVLVRHNNGLETLYAHLNKITVKTGDTLKAGEILGLGGNTGRSTGYHLHFELRYLGNPINPNDIINFSDHTVRNSIFLLSSKNFEYKKEIDKIRYWTVRKGDTLGRISQRTGISINKLCSLNGLKRSSILRIGQRIRYT